MTAPQFTPRPSQAALYSEPLNPNENQTYGVDQVATMLGVSKQTLYSALKAGTCSIRCIKIAGSYRFPKTAVHDAIFGKQ